MCCLDFLNFFPILFFNLLFNLTREGKSNIFGNENNIKIDIIKFSKLEYQIIESLKVNIKNKMRGLSIGP